MKEAAVIVEKIKDATATGMITSKVVIANVLGGASQNA